MRIELQDELLPRQVVFEPQQVAVDPARKTALRRLSGQRADSDPVKNPHVDDWEIAE